MRWTHNTKCFTSFLETSAKLAGQKNHRVTVSNDRVTDALSSSSFSPSSSAQTKQTNSSYYVRPVCLSDVRSAWSMIFLLSERQAVVDALMRAVRRLVVSSLYQLLVTQTPEGLGESSCFASFAAPATNTTAPAVTPAGMITTSVSSSDSATLQGTQQRIINLFIILYECPFATDPLHFEVSTIITV